MSRRMQFFQKSRLSLDLAANSPGNRLSTGAAQPPLAATCFEYFTALDQEFYVIGFVQSLAKLYQKVQIFENARDSPSHFKYSLKELLTIRFPVKGRSISSLAVTTKLKKNTLNIYIVAGSVTGYVNLVHVVHEQPVEKSSFFSLSRPSTPEQPWRYKLQDSCKAKSSICSQVIQQTETHLEVHLVDLCGIVYCLNIDYATSRMDLTTIFSEQDNPVLEIARNTAMDTLLITPHDVLTLPTKTVLNRHTSPTDAPYQTLALASLPNNTLILAKNTALYQKSTKSVGFKHVFTHEYNIFTVKTLKNSCCVLIFDELESIFLIDLLNARILLRMVGVEFGYQPAIYKGIGIDFEPVASVMQFAESCSAKNLVRIVENPDGSSSILLFLKTEFIDVKILQPKFDSELAFNLILEAQQLTSSRENNKLLQILTALLLDNDVHPQTYLDMVSDLPITAMNFMDLCTIYRVLDLPLDFLERLDLQDPEVVSLVQQHATVVARMVAHPKCSSMVSPDLTRVLMKKEELIRPLVLTLPIHTYDINWLITTSQDYDLMGHLFIQILGDELGFLEYLAARIESQDQLSRCPSASDVASETSFSLKPNQNPLSVLILLLTCILSNIQYTPLKKAASINLKMTEAELLDFCSKNYRSKFLTSQPFYDFLSIIKDEFEDFVDELLSRLVERSESFQEIYFLPQNLLAHIGRNVELFLKFKSVQNDALKTVLCEERHVMDLLPYLSESQMEIVLAGSPKNKVRYQCAKHLRKFDEIYESLNVELVHQYINDIELTDTILHQIETVSTPTEIKWLLEINDIFQMAWQNYKNFEPIQPHQCVSPVPCQEPPALASETDYDKLLDSLSEPQGQILDENDGTSVTQNQKSMRNPVIFDPLHPKSSEILELRGFETVSEILRTGICTEKDAGVLLNESLSGKMSEMTVLHDFFKDKSLQSTMQRQCQNILILESASVVRQLYSLQSKGEIVSPDELRSRTKLFKKETSEFNLDALQKFIDLYY